MTEAERELQVSSLRVKNGATFSVWERARRDETQNLYKMTDGGFKRRNKRAMKRSKRRVVCCLSEGQRWCFVFISWCYLEVSDSLTRLRCYPGTNITLCLNLNTLCSAWPLEAEIPVMFCSLSFHDDQTLCCWHHKGCLCMHAHVGM